MISRLGVYGGMFDPVHKGHIDAACHVRNLLNLELVKLIPCKQPNHRDHALASAVDRVAMLELAIADRPGLEVDTCELDRDGISYAVETLEYLHEEFTGSQLVFILGMDSFNSLAAWHRWESLENLCHLIVLPRGDDHLDSELGEALHVGERRVEQPEQLFSRQSGNIYIDTEFAHSASSSQVRSALLNGDDATEYLNRKVLDFIVERGLYGIHGQGISSGSIANGK